MAFGTATCVAADAITCTGTEGGAGAFTGAGAITGNGD